ncbi:calcium-binding protein [Microvirga pudoricolor]|uniref:calcium-binding protein n=1 Tax=Microvirga pudoricolor TaxID=2778729 RepID=UPI0019516BE4|nr:calcium-binding protein [Microvirga pudoricolor]MBM6594483.1 hypothetical protein [Microvirga pudoricolor]
MANFYGTDIDDYASGTFDDYYGGGGHDFLMGNAAGNALYGGEGNDVLSGSYYTSYTGDGTVNAPWTIPTGNPSGSDYLEGGAGIDLLLGYDGDDILYGGAGNDSGVMLGWTGDYWYAGLYGGSGNDYLDGGAGNDLLEGGADNDTLVGGDGSDTLRGDSGADRMEGGNGSDVYYVDNAGDTVLESPSSGYDYVYTTVSYALEAQSEVEYLAAFGAGVLSLTGSSSDNTIVGNAANNAIDGGMGADTMLGGAGDDTYRVDNPGDTIYELANEGTDTVLASADHTLGLELENLFSTGGFALTGNAFANLIVGHGGANKLNGGLGNDTLTGGAGKDVFVFDTKPDDTANYDRITDFNVRDDTIHLENAVFKYLGKAGALKASAFWKGAEAHDSSDRVIYDAKKGIVFYDPDGSGSRDQVEIARIGKNLKITEKDFFVI